MKVRLIIASHVLSQSFCELRLSLASEKCQQEKRKTVNGEDIVFAMTSLGFENYGEALKIYLTRYRQVCYMAEPPPSTRAATLLPLPSGIASVNCPCELIQSRRC